MESHLEEFVVRAFVVSESLTLINRFKGSFVSNRKAQVMKFVLPFYKHPNEGKEYKDVCTKKLEIRTPRVETPYEVFLAREVREKFSNATMIAILHRNSCTMYEEYDFKVAIHKHGMELKAYNQMVLNLALKDTIFEPIMSLWNPDFMCVFGKKVAVQDLEKAMKMHKQYVLLAGVLDNRLLNHNDFLRYGKMDLTMTRAGLVQVLQSSGGNNLNRQLTHHQTTLLSHLKQIGTNESPCDENK